MLDSIFTVIELRNHGNSIKFHLKLFWNLSGFHGISLEFHQESIGMPFKFHWESKQVQTKSLYGFGSASMQAIEGRMGVRLRQLVLLASVHLRDVPAVSTGKSINES